ncbi:hypothetical protein DB347_11645, partial [Opitutaceae bacterium EW11]
HSLMKSRLSANGLSLEIDLLILETACVELPALSDANSVGPGGRKRSGPAPQALTRTATRRRSPDSAAARGRAEH